jgi:hypothetical protein
MHDVDVTGRNRSPRRLVALLLALAVLVVVGVPARALSRLYARMDALSASVREGDIDAAAPELDKVAEFYVASRKWGFQWLGDYLFADAALHRAAVAYLAEDYATVVKDLERRVDDPRAAFLLGCAKFRIAQRRYRQIAGSDAAATASKDGVIDEVVESINPDFERAVRADSNDTFAYKWNYDLTGNAEAIRRALETPKISEPPELEERKGAQSPIRRRRG